MSVRPSPVFEIDIDRAPKGSRDAAATMYRQLRSAIVDGRLAPGARLPSARQAPAAFGVSRSTASEVYARLTHEGCVVGRQGSGTYVARTLPPVVDPEDVVAPHAGDPRLNPFWLRADVRSAIGFWDDGSPVSPSSLAEGSIARRTIDFRPALVDARLFPHEVYRRLVARQLRGLERRPASLRSPQGNQGHRALREAITWQIAVTRAVPCRPDDVLVTAGAQQAFDVLARTLVVPGRTVVALEDPGYPPLRVAFAAAGARLVAIGVDDEGLIVDDLPADVGLVCVTPSHQFPLGVALSARRRAALVAFARAHGAVIVEDDYDGEYRFDGSPLEALRRQEAADVVFYVGTFSKCMLPALRLGFVVAPAWAMPTLVAAKNSMDWHCPTVVQASVAAFVADGHLTRHVVAMRTRYRERRDLLLAFVRDALGAWLRPVPSSYGMHVTALADPAIDLEAVTARLAERGVRMHTLDRYHVDQPRRNGLVLGYGVADPTQLRQGLGALREVLAAAGR